MKKVSAMDELYYRMAREHIEKAFDLHPGTGQYTLEIGPQELRSFGMASWKTLDINPGCDYQGDITKHLPFMDSTWDAVMCLDVLEHTLQPFDAIKELRRILKPGGLLVASAPLNFRIHGPKNDCWRFTEHGIRVLMKDFDGLVIDILETPDRFLMPVHYNWAARCNKEKNVTGIEKTFRWIE